MPVEATPSTLPTLDFSWKDLDIGLHGINWDILRHPLMHKNVVVVTLRGNVNHLGAAPGALPEYRQRHHHQVRGIR